MLDEYGRRLSARQKLTRETLVFFGNFTRQNGVVEHQLDIGFQAVTAGQLSNARQQERCTFFTNNALLFGFGDGLIYGCIDRFLRHRKLFRDRVRYHEATVQPALPFHGQFHWRCRDEC